MYKRILIIMYFYPYEYRKMSHTTLSWDETSIPLISQSVLEKFEEVLKLVRVFFLGQTAPRCIGRMSMIWVSSGLLPRSVARTFVFPILLVRLKRKY